MRALPAGKKWYLGPGCRPVVYTHTLKVGEYTADVGIKLPQGASEVEPLYARITDTAYMAGNLISCPPNEAYGSIFKRLDARSPVLGQLISVLCQRANVFPSRNIVHIDLVESTVRGLGRKLMVAVLQSLGPDWVIVLQPYPLQHRSGGDDRLMQRDADKLTRYYQGFLPGSVIVQTGKGWSYRWLLASTKSLTQKT